MTVAKQEEPYDLDDEQVEKVRIKGKLNLNNPNIYRLIIEQAVPQVTNITPGKNDFLSFIFH